MCARFTPPNLPRALVFAGLVVSLVLGGCGLYSPVEVREISTWHDVQVDLRGMQAEFEVTVYNPNIYRLVVANVVIEVLMDGEKIGEATLGTNETVVLPPGELAVVPFAVQTVEGGGATLVRRGAAALFGTPEDLDMQLQGTVRVRGFGLTKDIVIRHNEPLKLN